MKQIVDVSEVQVPGGMWRSRINVLIGVALVAALASVYGYFSDAEQFSFSYLVAFVFFVSLGLAGLFFVMLQHLTRAGWSVAIRRIPETMMTTLPFFAVLFIPVFLGRHDLYHWTHHDAVEHDALLQHKEPFLNTGFFLIRAVVYFVVWGILVRYFYSRSVAQDSTRDPSTTVTMQRRSAPGMILFAVTLTFMAFDWLMSLDPHWYSTIFGVYVFAGSVLAGFAVILLVASALERGGHLPNVLQHDHFRDLGRLLFAFTVFWAYIAFSQFFLIWYGNIPEETLFYVHRREGTWDQATTLLALGHFVVPFVVLMSRWTKNRRPVLMVMAVWILCMHYLDLYWLVMPVLHHEGVHLHWMDLACLVAVGAVFLVLFIRQLGSRPLVPIGDPRLAESLGLHTDY